jgi:V8-like Glu-specific endopeptidase
MPIRIQLSGRVNSPIEGPIPVWRVASPRTTVGTELALADTQPQSVSEAMATDEKLIGVNNLVPISFLEQALQLADAVALIQVGDVGTATGFLVAADILLTNNHVLGNADDASVSVVRFRYQMDMLGRLEQSEYVRCLPDSFFYTNPDLDYSLVRLDSTPGLRYGVIPLSGSTQINDGDHVNIIQHPLGQPKQIAMVDNEVQYVDDTVTQYLTDTLPGSSGSPVFNDSWELVALHHSGGWIPEPSDGSTHFRNEGIRISAIMNDLVKLGLAG